MIKEPMLYFILGAMLLYLLFHVVLDSPPQTVEQTMQINNQLLNTLRNSFQLQYQRQPQDNELAGLLRDYVEEEAQVREAKRLQLDQDDPVIRRRLVQKLHFLFQNLDDQVSMENLEQYYQLHASRYTEPATLEFDQVYFAADPPTLDEFTQHRPTGNAFALGNSFNQANVEMIQRTFGPQFVTQLEALPLNRWQGPVTSAYGFHFIRVRIWNQPQQQPFSEIKDQVKADYLRQQQIQLREQSISQIVKRQPVQIEPDIKALVGQWHLN